LGICNSQWSPVPPHALSLKYILCNYAPSCVVLQHHRHKVSTYFQMAWWCWLNWVAPEFRNCRFYQMRCSSCDTHGFNSLYRCPKWLIFVPTLLTVQHWFLFKIESPPLYSDFSPTMSKSDQWHICVLAWWHAFYSLPFLGLWCLVLIYGLSCTSWEVWLRVWLTW
jgi:hypothetical protein